MSWYNDININIINLASITFQIDRLSHTINTDEPSAQEAEVLQHWILCREKSQVLGGREDILEIVQSYVISSSDQPLILHGESGAGKSSIIAQVATEVHLYLRPG